MHLCEIENPQDLPTLEFPFNVRKGRPLLVAVKILRPDASKNARSVASMCNSAFNFWCYSLTPQSHFILGSLNFTQTKQFIFRHFMVFDAES